MRQTFHLVEQPSGELAPADAGRTWLPDAGIAIGHGMLVGELLGVDIAPLEALFDEIERSRSVLREHVHESDSVESRLYPEDIAVLTAGLTLVSQALNDAIDVSGRAVGECGARLAASEHIQRDENNRLVVRDSQLSLSELRSRLKDLDTFLHAASTRNASLRITA